MVQKSTEERKKYSLSNFQRKLARKDRWYIVDTTNLLKFLLLRLEFKSERQANRVLDRYFAMEPDYEVISGKEARASKIRFKKKRVFLTEYDYPKSRVTYQDKKSFRTKARRYARRAKKRGENVNLRSISRIPQLKVKGFYYRP